MDGLTLSLVAAGLAVAGIVKGATGVGYVTCALPGLVQAFGLEAAMALVIAPALATNVSALVPFGAFWSLLKGYWPLYLAMIPGVAAGVVLLSWLDAKTALLVLGVVLVGYCVLSLAKRAATISPVTAGRLMMPVGFANGVLTGLTGSQVLPLVPYMMAQDIEPGRAVQAINIGVLILTSVMGIGLFWNNLVNPDLFALSVLAVVPALAGVALGFKIRARLPAARLRTAVFVVTGLIGLKMIVS